MRRITSVFLLLVVLSACQVIGGGDGSDTNDGAANSAPILIDWDRSPSAIVFRAEVTGGEDEDAIFTRNEVPPCTIYGDNRVVWRVDTAEGTQILFDRLTDLQIRTFVENLTIQQQIYTFEAGIERELPTSTEPVMEQITLSVNDVTHVTDSFSDWDLDFFQDVVNECQTISEAPIEFVPEAGWVSAEVIDYNLGAPLISWDAEGAGLSLAELASSGERRWIDDNGRLLRVLWNLIRTSPPNLQFSEGNDVFQIALEVPNVNPTAPPAPEN